MHVLFGCAANCVEELAGWTGGGGVGCGSSGIGYDANAANLVRDPADGGVYKTVETNMKLTKFLKQAVVLVVTAAVLSGPAVALAQDAKDTKEVKKAKPYTLKTCAVSGEKLGSMGDPYVFEHDGREYKLCCKGCLKDFKKEPKKYSKAVEKAETEAAKKAKK